jgi:hypothetical protein
LEPGCDRSIELIQVSGKEMIGSGDFHEHIFTRCLFRNRARLVDISVLVVASVDE